MEDRCVISGYETHLRNPTHLRYETHQRRFSGTSSVGFETREFVPENQSVEGFDVPCIIAGANNLKFRNLEIQNRPGLSLGWGGWRIGARDFTGAVSQ